MRAMRRAVAILLARLALAAQPPSPADLPSIGNENLRPLLARVAEEADAMAHNITSALTTETLEQRGKLPSPRFHPRIGAAAASVPPVRSVVRQIVSEYTVGALKETGSPDLHEFRQVISVDGKPVRSENTASRSLAEGMQSPSDRARKRMLEQFAKYGLVDIATDYGLILLAFTRREWPNLEFGPSEEARLGTDAAVVVAWRQLSTAAGALEFHGRKAVHESLAGRLWMRKSDGVPLRIEAWAELQDGQHRVRDQATIDYVMSSHGFPAPVSVVHRHSVDGEVTAENLYRYDAFRMFSANADIKFTTEPPEPPPSKP